MIKLCTYLIGKVTRIPRGFIKILYEICVDLSEVPFDIAYTLLDLKGYTNTYPDTYLSKKIKDLVYFYYYR